MKFTDLKAGKVYFLPVQVLKILPVKDRIKICKKVDKQTGKCTIEEEAVEGYPFPPYVALWNGKCKYIGEDTYKHFMTASEIAGLLQRKAGKRINKTTKTQSIEQLTLDL